MGRANALAAALLLVVACQSATSPAPTAPAATATSQPAVSGSPAPAASSAASAATAALTFSVQTFPVPRGAGPHDVAPASDGGVWYSGQQNGTLGWLDPATGQVTEVDLGARSAPHGVISGPDGAAWVTDPGRNALVRVEPGTFKVTSYPIPASAGDISVHTAVFDHDGVLWFTGQRGYVGRMDPASRSIDVIAAPRGAGPYGITVTPSNDVYFASLQQSYLGAVDRERTSIEVLEPPTADAGVRRAWSDTEGRVWISEWNAGQLGMYDPATRASAEPPRWPTPCTSTSSTPRGCRTSDRTRSCASTVEPRRSCASIWIRTLPTCASSSDGRARSGAPSRRPTGSW
jgi:streptogramin lyase